MVNYSLSPIPKVEENKKHYTAFFVKKADCARQFQHITVQQVNQILHAVDNNILQNLPILWEDSGMADDIYGSSVPCLKAKTVRHKIHHV